MLPFTLTENLALHAYRKPPNSRRGFLNLRAMLARARKLLKEFDVRGGTPTTPAGALSGGNQQKVVLAREIDGDPKVLIAAQPTRGLDVGAIEFVHRRLVEQRDAGRAILLVSLELEEILSLSDRILVIYEGRIVGEFPPTATEEELGLRDDRRPARGGGCVTTTIAASRRARGRRTTGVRRLRGALGPSPAMHFASRFDGLTGDHRAGRSPRSSRSSWAASSSR